MYAQCRQQATKINGDERKWEVKIGESEYVRHEAMSRHKPRTMILPSSQIVPTTLRKPWFYLR